MARDKGCPAPTLSRLPALKDLQEQVLAMREQMAGHQALITHLLRMLLSAGVLDVKQVESICENARGDEVFASLDIRLDAMYPEVRLRKEAARREAERTTEDD